MRYSPQFLEHFRNPRYRGPLVGATCSGEARFKPCGDWMRLEIRVLEGRVTDARFTATGCGAAVAAGSAGVELLLGREVAAARRVTAFELDRALGGLPPQKRHALLMFLECLGGALGPRGADAPE